MWILRHQDQPVAQLRRSLLGGPERPLLQYPGCLETMYTVSQTHSNACAPDDEEITMVSTPGYGRTVLGRSSGRRSRMTRPVRRTPRGGTSGRGAYSSSSDEPDTPPPSRRRDDDDGGCGMQIFLVVALVLVVIVASVCIT